MVKIQFETGQTVEFDGNPTQADIEEVAKSFKPIQQNVQPKTPVAQPEKQSFISSTQPTFKASEGGATSIPKNVAKTIGNIPSSARNLVRNTIAPVNPFDTQSPINIGANIAKGASDIKSLVKGVKDIGVGGTAKALAGGVGSIFKKGADIYKGVGQKIYNNLEENAVGNNSVSSGVGTSIAQGISNVAKVGVEDPLLIPSLIYAPSNVRGTGFTDDAISKLSGLNKVDTKLSTVLPKAKAVFEPSTKALEQKVVAQFEKGVKPLLNARSTPEMVKKYKDNIVNATKVINDNKTNLSFVDDIGDVTVGKNPQTLQQLSEAVDQTKKSVFSEYNALTKKSGEKGLTVKTDNIANELDTVIADEALQISNPTAVQYARDLKDRLSYRELSPEVTENVIKNYNESLKAFYKNPSYDNASKASIDALIVNKLRQQLDEGITGLTGEQYQTLKNKYGALKTIENDVLKATLREARKNNKGLIDFTDIFSGSDILTGILSMNPAQIARGATARGVKEYYKYLNSPNRAVKKMFNSTEKLNQRSIPKIDLTNSPSTVSESQLKIAPNTNIPITPNINDIPVSIQPIKNKSIPLKNTQAGFISTGNKDLQPLYKEAQKYKSAEEFVNKQTPVYRADTNAFDPKLMNDKAGLFVAPSKTLAGFYSEGGKRPVQELFISPKAKILEWKDIPEKLKNFDNKDIEAQQILIKKYAKDNGYDVVGYEPAVDYKYGIENQIVNPDIIKTKSQLEQIWKEVNAKTSTNKGMTAINPLTVGAGVSALGAGAMAIKNKNKK